MQTEAQINPTSADQPRSAHLRPVGLPARVATIAAVAWALLGFASAAAAAPSVQVTPATGLTDGQQVSVTVSGFSPNILGNLFVIECSQSSSSQSDCDVNDGKLFQSTNSSGNLTVTMTVRAKFGANDCARVGCMIVAHTGMSESSGVTAQQNIQFGAPPRTSPAPSHTSTPGTTAPPATHTSATVGTSVIPPTTGVGPQSGPLGAPTRTSATKQGSGSGAATSSHTRSKAVTGITPSPTSSAPLGAVNVGNGSGGSAHATEAVLVAIAFALVAGGSAVYWRRSQMHAG